MAKSIQNRGPQLLGVDIGFLEAAIIANALRCYVRIRTVKGFGNDGWLMAFATLSFICYYSFSIAGVHYGSGRHHSDLETEDMQRATYYWWLCCLFYALSRIASRLSIGSFLLRIAVKCGHVWIIYFAMFISVLAGVLFFFVSLFQCWPISYFWDKTSQSGYCISMDVIVGLSYLYTVFSIISDFTFAILPAFLVWGLQLTQRTKMALIPLLTMGCIASSAVVARVPYVNNFHDPDFFWAIVDQGLAITAGSLATLRPLFSLFFARIGYSSGPSKLRPSRYGPASPSASRILGSGGRRKPSVDRLNAYGMRSFTETTCAPANALDRAAADDDEEKGGLQLQSNQKGGLGKRRVSFVRRMKGPVASRGGGGGGRAGGGAKDDSESQKSLKRAGSEGEIGPGAEDGMAIGV